MAVSIFSSTINRIDSSNSKLIKDNNNKLYLATSLKSTTADENNNIVKVFSSTDDGATWIDTNMPTPNLKSEKSANIFVDSNNNVHVTYIGRDDIAPDKLYHALFSNGVWSSTTFGTTVANGITYHAQTVKTCIDSSNNIHVIYKYNIDNIYCLCYVKRNSNGVFGNVIQVRTSSINMDVVSFAIDNINNNFYVSIYESSNKLLKYDINLNVLGEVNLQYQLLDVVVKDNKIYACSGYMGQYLEFDLNLNTLYSGTFSNGKISVVFENNVSIKFRVYGDKIYLSKFNGVLFSDEKQINYTNLADAISLRETINNNIYIVYDEEIGITHTLKFEKTTSKIAKPYVSNLIRASLDVTLPAVFSWNFNDIDAGDVQGIYQLQILDANASTPVYDSSQVTSSVNTYTLPANTLTPGLNYQWRVKVWDSNNTVSDWSTIAIFNTGNKPTIGITAPSDTVNVSNTTVTWTYASITNKSQQKYSIILQDTGVDVYNTGEIINTDGFSNATEKIITISYTAPAIPTLLATGNVLNGSILISITNPTPTGTQPSILYNDLYKLIYYVWVRIATNIPNNGYYTDYTALGTEKYKTRAVGSNNTTTESGGYIEGTLNLNNIILGLLDGTCINIIYDVNKKNINRQEINYSKFAGRKKSVTEFGEHTDKEISLSFMLMTMSDVDELEWLIYSKQTLVYRDKRGRKMFCTCSGYDVTDAEPSLYDISLALTETDYSQEV
jgi:hypothetical protein